MTDPTPRPPVGTDLAPCPDCGGELEPMRSAFEPDKELAFRCSHCEREIDHVRDQGAVTLAGAPWTRALWAEVERMRTEVAELRQPAVRWSLDFEDAMEAADLTQEGAVLDGPGGAVVRMAREVERLRLELVAEQGWQDRIARAAFVAGSAMAHDATVDGRYNCDPGGQWDEDPSIFDDVLDEASMRAAMKAADEAEAQAAAKEPTPAADIYDQALTVAMSEPLTPPNARDLTMVQAFRPTGPARSELSVRCPVCDNRQTLRPLVCEVFECHGHSVTIRCEGGRIVSWTERSPAAKEPTAAEHSGRVWLTGIHGYHLGKFEAVKAIRSVAGLGLREAMTLVESVSTEPLIPLRADRDRAADIAILRAAGCQLRIEEPTP